MNTKRIAAVLALCLATAAQADGLTAEQTAQAAAVADGVSTAVALSAGAVEANGLIPTDPVGLVAVTALKAALPVLVRDAAPETRKAVLVTASGVWGGAAVNNLLIAAGATTPVGLVVGLVAGLWIGSNTADKVDQEIKQ